MTTQTAFYDAITESIIAKLEQVNPSDWEKPWFSLSSIAKNATTGKQYRGINIFLLSGHSLWATFNQWQANGCQINKGESGTAIYFWSFAEKKQTLAEESAGLTPEKYAFLKKFTVFHSGQVTGDFAREKEQEQSATPLNPNLSKPEIDSVIADYMQRESIRQQVADYAAYSPLLDTVKMPLIGQFRNADSFYATFLHELAHSTGHEKRLARLADCGGFGSESYAKEELVAELTSAMLCAELGVTNYPQENHAAYIKSWLKALRDDKRLIMKAASQAQKACDLIQNRVNRDEIALAA